MVDSVEKNAWKNYLKRYGMACPTDRIGPDWVRAVPDTAATGTPAPESPGKSDGASREFVVKPEFVNSCGRDAARLDAWIELCKTAKCEVVQ